MNDLKFCAACYYTANRHTRALKKLVSLEEVKMCNLLDEKLNIRGSIHDRVSGTNERPLVTKNQYLPVGCTHSNSKVDYYVSPSELKLAMNRGPIFLGQRGHPTVHYWLAMGDTLNIFRGVVVEYDGEYYHQRTRRKQKDKEKRDNMVKEGYLVYKVSNIHQGLLQSHSDDHTKQIYDLSEFRNLKLFK